jgi:hypothetical protein
MGTAGVVQSQFSILARRGSNFRVHPIAFIHSAYQYFVSEGLKSGRGRGGRSATFNKWLVWVSLSQPPSVVKTQHFHFSWTSSVPPPRATAGLKNPPHPDDLRRSIPFNLQPSTLNLLDQEPCVIGVETLHRTDQPKGEDGASYPVHGPPFVTDFG